MGMTPLCAGQVAIDAGTATPGAETEDEPGRSAGVVDARDGMVAGEFPVDAEALPHAAPAAESFPASVGVTAPAKGRSRAITRATSTTTAKVTPVRRSLNPMPPCPGDVCRACWNERHGRQPGGAHDRGWTGLRCVFPLQGKRRRLADLEAGLADALVAADVAGDAVDSEYEAAELVGYGDLGELERVE